MALGTPEIFVGILGYPGVGMPGYCLVWGSLGILWGYSGVVHSWTFCGDTLRLEKGDGPGVNRGRGDKSSNPTPRAGGKGGTIRNTIVTSVKKKRAAESRPGVHPAAGHGFVSPKPRGLDSMEVSTCDLQ